MEVTCYGRNLLGRILLAIWCFVLCGSVGSARTVYFLDDFENGLGQWETGVWQLTEAFFRSANHAISESPEGPHPSKANSTIVMKVRSQKDLVDLSESADPVLAFWHRLDVHPDVYAYVEISEDFGFTWSELASFNGVRQSTWSRVQVDLSDYKAARIMIRFRLTDHGGSSWEGWDIDDVLIAERDNQTLALPFFDDFESGLDDWMVEAGDAWKLTENFYRSSGHAISESPAGNSRAHELADLILAHPVDLSTMSFPILTFWHQISLHPGGYASVDVSEDGGTTWTELAHFSGVQQSTWSRVQLDLSAYRTAPATVRFRFDNGSTAWDGWDIDDVEIRELFYEQFPHTDPADSPDPAEPLDPLVVKITSVDASECPTIQASVIVVDANDEPVTGLHTSNFSIYEDGTAQTPVRVEPSSSAVRASLVLDYSRSMTAEALEALETASRSFVDCMVAGDHAELIKFAAGVDVVQEYTDDGNALRQAIEREPAVDLGSTALYDAIYQAISGAARQTGSRAVVAMSDGADNHSDYSATGVIEHALVEGVPVFTIGLGNLIDEDVLIAIAAKTGGLYYFAPTPQELETIYQKIAGTLNTQYLVTYDTTIHDAVSSGDVEHNLKIAVSLANSYGDGAKQFTRPASCSLIGDD